MTTRGGKAVPLSSILAILINPFYYGEYQYIVNGEAKWYKGAHKPLISKELFTLVQKGRGINKGLWGSKTFAFRGLLQCGHCGAEITAQDKIKIIKKTGDYKRFVYYNCTIKDRSRCNAKYMNEDRLCELLQEFIEKNYKKMRLSDKLQARVERHNHIAQTLPEHYGVVRQLETPLVEYARYVLARGTEAEKTSLAANIRTKLQIKNDALQFVK